MSIFDNLKNLFGFTPHRTGAAPTPEPVLSDPEPAVSRVEPVVQPAASVPKPAPSGPPPAAQRRDQLLGFVIGKLRPYQNEPGAAPTGLRLHVAVADPEEAELYRVALWDGQPGKFRTELDRQLADNYIKLRKDWRFEYVLTAGALPGCTYREGNLGLVVLDDSTPDGPPRLARIVALIGQTEQADYPLDPTLKTSFCIGRGHTTQTTSGRVRTNDIVFLNDDDPGFDARQGAGNGAVSRAHATIRYVAGQKRYVLLVDPGGLPASGNKTKILHPDDRIERADIAGMSYLLDDGDQIELGGTVTLLFTHQ
ncbi:MAG: FHA domain-containing protein [Bacteroidetes bacterium]|nr:FHA domain-containing protein [Fibrella sp.]